MQWQNHISVDPDICHGSACIKGTRVQVSVIVDSLAAGETAESIATAYRITLDDVRAAMLYAAEVVRERIVRLPGAA